MSGHTPGPWRIDPQFRGDIQSEDGRLEICTVDAQGYSCHNYPSPQLDEALANARLIAAAPDLLAALEGCVEHGVFGSNVSEVRNRARAAIAKARGES